MGLMIEDGSGKGYQAKVDHANRIHVYAISESLEHHTNIIHGESYNLIFSQTATGPDECIVYIKNLSDEFIIFEGITANAASNETLSIVINDSGTPVDGINASPGNLNGGSNNQAIGDFEIGNNITGLSGGFTILNYFFKGGDASKYFNFEQDIILPKSRTLTIYCTSGSILVDGFLSFFYHHID
jgi:hypothetical protein